jgi:DNA-binding transcriptional ArsR family regulator
MKVSEHVPGELPQWLALIKYFEYTGNMEEKDVIRALAALAHELRLRVFRMLVVAGPSGLTPGVMAEQFDVPNATLSFHLKDLMHAGLVTQERDGRSLIYRAAYDQMNAVLGFLTENCCQGQPCLEPGAASCKC